MADQTTDSVVEPIVTAVPEEAEESIFPNVHDIVQASEPQTTDPVVPASEAVAENNQSSDDDQKLVKTLSDNGIATLQEVKKLFERVQDLEEDNRRLQEMVSSKNIEVKNLTQQTSKVADLEITIGELRKKLDAQYDIIQKVRQEADKNMFTKGYTIPEDVVSLVKNTTR